MENTRTSLEFKFNRKIKSLNEQQKAVVENIEGPMLVVAGPGTGKTETIAMRIGKILLQTDSNPSNILCLTFTESGTIAMRKRLLNLIGPAAHQIHINTFHGFCNQVIQENPGIFGNYRKLEVLTEIEKIEVYQEILDSLHPGHLLKRYKSDPVYNSRRLQSLFRFMKMENLSPDFFFGKVEEFIQYKSGDRTDKDLFYQINRKPNKAGDLKQAKWKEFANRMEELKTGIQLFESYETITDRRGRYDYEDMLLWVIRAFETSGHLLGTYQEKYHYYLVDEYQDTNGSQKRILELLTNFWENPNVFAVGDDDQSIYKFQGANLENIKDFIDRYDPGIVVLTKNYRSTQSILDAANNLIVKNEGRLVNLLPGLSKVLTSTIHPSSSGQDPEILAFDNFVYEQSYIANKIVDRYKNTGQLSQLAVIYRKHRQVEKLAYVLENKGIPVNIRRQLNLLNMQLSKNLLKILEYLNKEYNTPHSGESLLFELMHYKFFDIKALDIAKIALYIQEADHGRHIAWREIMSDESLMKELALSDHLSIHKFSLLVEKWIKDISDCTLQTTFQNIINEGHILKTIMKSEEKTWQLHILSSFFDFVKEESARDPELTISSFLEIVRKYNIHGIDLPVHQLQHSEKGVNFLTAHSSKGLEFEDVFIIGCSKDIWDRNSRRSNQFKYPDNIPGGGENSKEDERRLFYVAMTRAKTKLTISFPQKKENGNDLGQSQFVDELLTSNNIQLTQPTVLPDSINEFLYLSMLKIRKPIRLVDRDHIDRFLENYALSVTGLNKYLKCPLSFYFENILKVPLARSLYMGFGRAIHRALQLYFMDWMNEKDSTKKSLINGFQSSMKEHRSHFTAKEFKDMLEYGEIVLSKYYLEYLKELQEADEYYLEHRILRTEYKGIPIKGILDKVEITDKKVKITDYKTGRYDNHKTKNKLQAPNARHPEGGDYWRQIVFYKILMDSDRRNNWIMDVGEIDFIEPLRNSTKFARYRFEVSPEEIEIVGDQIRKVWEKLHKYEFDQLCEDEECYWCNFVRNDFVFYPEFEPEFEDQIQELP